MPGAAKTAAVWLGVALVARLAGAQATLPTAYTGPWQYYVYTAGWDFQALGADQNPDYDGLNDGAARLQTSGAYVSIHYDRSAGAVTYWIKGLTFSGGVFRVEQSIDGVNWWALAAYAELPGTPLFETRFPALEARHLRFIYDQKVTGNVGLDGVSVYPWRRPGIGHVELASGTALVTVADTAPGRTYALDYAAKLTGNPVAWTQADSGTAAAEPLVLSDGASTNAAVRFYRVRDATP